MADDDAPDAGDQTVGARQDSVNPDDCATLVTREISVTELAPQPKRSDEQLELRIETIDRIINALDK